MVMDLFVKYLEKKRYNSLDYILIKIDFTIYFFKNLKWEQRDILLSDRKISISKHTIKNRSYLHQ